MKRRLDEQYESFNSTSVTDPIQLVRRFARPEFNPVRVVDLVPFHQAVAEQHRHRVGTLICHDLVEVSVAAHVPDRHERDQWCGTGGIQGDLEGPRPSLLLEATLEPGALPLTVRPGKLRTHTELSDWLRAHPERAAEVMTANRSYVVFRTLAARTVPSASRTTSFGRCAPAGSDERSS